MSIYYTVRRLAEPRLNYTVDYRAPLDGGSSSFLWPSSVSGRCCLAYCFSYSLYSRAIAQVWIIDVIIMHMDKDYIQQLSVCI